TQESQIPVVLFSREPVSAEIPPALQPSHSPSRPTFGRHQACPTCTADCPGEPGNTVGQAPLGSNSSERRDSATDRQPTRLLDRAGTPKWLVARHPEPHGPVSRNSSTPVPSESTRPNGRQVFLHRTYRGETHRSRTGEGTT